MPFPALLQRPLRSVGDYKTYFAGTKKIGLEFIYDSDFD
jgi:hypothetical protein